MTVKFEQHVEDAAVALEEATSPVVAVPVFNAYDDTVRCLESLLAHTPVETTLLLVDDAGDDRRFFGLLDSMGAEITHEIVVLANRKNKGFIQSCNDVFEATVGRDVVLVNSDVVVGPGWLKALTDAANSSNLIATASTLTNHGTILSVPNRNQPMWQLPGALMPDEAARRVKDASLRLRPTIPTAIGHCMYIKRKVLDLIGGFDPAFGRGYGEEVDFSQRAVRIGLRHVCADDVFTYHRGGSSFGGDREALQNRNEREVEARYPWYSSWVNAASNDGYSALAVALARASMSLRGLHLGVDAMCIGPHYTGTQHVVLRMIDGLAAQDDLGSLVVYLPQDAPSEVRSRLERTDGVTVCLVDTLEKPPQNRVDVVFRPYQLGHEIEIRWLRQAAMWVVVSQLDMIAFNDPAYHEDGDAWLNYRMVARLGLDAVDGISFISEHGMSEAEAEGLPRPEVPRRVIYCGTDGDGLTEGLSEQMPDGLEDDERPLLFCLGHSFAHKNRELAVAAWIHLRDSGWDGRLVLAGPTPPHGTSHGEEARSLLTRQQYRQDLIVLGSITQKEKTWLYRRSTVVLYPSMVEGFGLVPFEAAAYGAATLSSRQGSLAEVLPENVPFIDNFRSKTVAEQIRRLVDDELERKRVVVCLRDHGSQFTWERSCSELRALIDEVTTRLPSRVVAIAGEGGPPKAVWQPGLSESMQ